MVKKYHEIEHFKKIVSDFGFESCQYLLHAFKVLCASHHYIAKVRRFEYSLYIIFGNVFPNEDDDSDNVYSPVITNVLLTNECR